MTRQPAERLRLDCLTRAGAVHCMTGRTYRGGGVRGTDIVAVSADIDGLDDLAGPGTIVVDARDLCLR